MTATIPLGTMTDWGRIAAVGVRDGEWYYMMISPSGSVSLMPSSIVEATR